MRMRVIVLGSGVIGVSTAYCLARSGAEVTVIDRQAGVALETSFANAGQISPGYASPWASPGLIWKALPWLLQRHAPLAIRPDGSLWQWQWIARLLQECQPDRYATNKARMVRLAEYSRDTLKRWRAEGLIQSSDYEGRSLGTLQIFRTKEQVAGAAKDVAVLERCGVPHALLDTAGCIAREPGLAAQAGLIRGGLYLPGDETGDCQLFTEQLAQQAKSLGVRFLLGHEVTALRSDGHRWTGVRLRSAQGVSVRQADACVVALASYGRDLLQPLGIHLPVYPVKGYSLTATLIDATKGPRSTVLDESFKVALTRFDQRLRVGGMAELSGFDLHKRAHRRATLEKVVQDLFPGCAQLSDAQFWTGLRPMTPDGTPVLGPTGLDGLWINTGHGTLGWTMACGSAELLSDLMMGRPTAIQSQDLGLGRAGTLPYRGNLAKRATKKPASAS
jgi:D-amino-acid dehydrogenase